jgi:hypothetical protein
LDTPREEEEAQENYAGIDYELGKKAVVDNTEVKDLFFARVRLDEREADSRDVTPLLELRKKFRR